MHVELIRGSFVDLTEFRFDAVLPSTARQIDVYNTAARAVVMVNTFKTLPTTEVLQKHVWAQSKKLVLVAKRSALLELQKFNTNISSCALSLRTSQLNSLQENVVFLNTKKPWLMTQV